jgi:hypothetical protein
MLNIPVGDIQSGPVSCARLATELRKHPRELPELVSQVRVLPDGVEVDASTAGLAATLQIAIAGHRPTISLRTAVRLRRHGHVYRLIQQDDRSRPLARPLASLINLLAKANCWWRQLAQGQFGIAELARREGVTASYVTRVVRLAFLSPTVTEAVLQGWQRTDLTCTEITIKREFPVCWSDQTKVFA